MKEIFLFILIIRPSLDYFSDINVIGMNPAAFLAILIVGLFLLEFLVTSRTRVSIDNNLFKCFFVYLLLIFPSVIVSERIGESAAEFLRYMSEIGCIFLSYKYCRRDSRYTRKIITAILMSSIIPLLVGFYQLATNKGVYDKDVGGYRIVSVFVHQNQFAIYLVVIITLCLLLINNKIDVDISKKYKRNVYIILGASLLNLLFTYSRTCWIWLAITLIGMVLFEVKGGKKILLFIAAIIVAYFSFDIIIGRFMDVSSGGTGGSLVIRRRIVNTMMSYAMEKPILGHGLGNFSYGTAVYLNKKIEAHNEYVKTFYDSGIFGVVGLAYYFMNILKFYIKKGIKENAIIIFFLLGFFIACFFTNTLSCLVGQIYLLTMITLTMIHPHN